MQGRPFVYASLGCALAVLGSCRTAGLQRAYMALDESGDRRRTIFDTQTKGIYCIGELASGRADVTVTARIRAPTLFDRVSGQMVAADITMGVGEVAPGKTERTIVSFKFDPPPGPANPPSDPTTETPAQPYLPGSYVCELSIDGHLEETVPFDITFGGCPLLPPATGAPCAGWVRPGTNCPGVSPAIACGCGDEGVWSCSP